MTSAVAPLLRILPTMLFCLTLTGAADATASTGPVVGWGNPGWVTPPDSVNGVSGTATHIATGRYHTLAMPEPTAWLAQLTGFALLCALHRSRARRRRGQA